MLVSGVCQSASVDRLSTVLELILGWSPYIQEMQASEIWPWYVIGNVKSSFAVHGDSTVYCPILLSLWGRMHKMDYVLLMEGGLNPFKCMLDALLTPSMLTVPVSDSQNSWSLWIIFVLVFQGRKLYYDLSPHRWSEDSDFPVKKMWSSLNLTKCAWR